MGMAGQKKRNTGSSREETKRRRGLCFWCFTPSLTVSGMKKGGGWRVIERGGGGRGGNTGGRGKVLG